METRFLAGTRPFWSLSVDVPLRVTRDDNNTSAASHLGSSISSKERWDEEGCCEILSKNRGVGWRCRGDTLLLNRDIIQGIGCGPTCPDQRARFGTAASGQEGKYPETTWRRFTLQDKHLSGIHDRILVSRDTVSRDT